MEAETATPNNNRKNSTPPAIVNLDKPKQTRKIAEPGEAIAGDSLGADTVARRFSKKPMTWKKLVKLPGVRTFSRNDDGKFVYLAVSKSRALSLDGLEPLTVPPDQQGMPVYRVWLNTF
ncbi:MAG TPA: hypothetical protein V6D48_22915 [Oculatellaceae cyanobacterium]